MERTVPSQYENESFVGYVLNSEFSDENKQKIEDLQEQIAREFGGAIWLPKPEWLHITLMDWLAPLVDYQQDKDDLFEEIRRPYNQALEDILKSQGPIRVNFEAISASPEAIFISGEDDGQYQAIRSGFLSRIELLPNTKQPPTIIHSTIARFNEAIDLDEIREFIASLEVSFTQTIDEFRLLRTTDTKMDGKLIIKKYKLHSP